MRLSVRSLKEAQEMSRQIVGVTAALAVCLWVTALHATQVLYRTPQELGRESVLVVQGRVTGVQSYWNETRSKIFTETQVAIDESYKGGKPATVRVLQLGGVVGHVRMNVAGSLAWTPGEEVLLFLEPSTAGAYQVSGFSQGKFKIERDPKTGVPYVSRPALENTEVLRASGGEAAGPDTGVARMPLERFVNEALSR
jgi:hypothetical protein